MKKFRTIALALAAVIGFAGAAQAQILYKVEKKDSGKTSYILGTHHFAPLAVIDSITELPEILNGVDCLYGEIDMSLMTDPSTMMAMQQKMMAPADSTLDKVLTPEQMAKLQSVLNQYAGGEVPLQMMAQLKPAVISTQLAAMISAKVFPQLDPTKGIDAVMQARAKELGKPVAGLETVDFQIDRLFNRPISEQAEALVKTISDIDAEEKMAVRLSNAYLAHDIDTILQLMLEAEAEDPAIAEKLIYSRNDNWIKFLTGEMPAKSMMVVVGAGHLPGDRGVLKGLEDAGFIVTPVK